MPQFEQIQSENHILWVLSLFLCDHEIGTWRNNV